MSDLEPAYRKVVPSLAAVVASPRAIANWATFTTGADQPHQTLADGLQITDVGTGGGAFAHTRDLLTVQYIGWLSDGCQVASSDSDGQLFKFTLGRGEVIAGWDEGVPGLGVGGIRRLVVPPALAYGPNGVINQSGAYVIPPNATLVFIVRLMSVTQSGVP